MSQEKEVRALVEWLSPGKTGWPENDGRRSGQLQREDGRRKKNLES